MPVLAYDDDDHLFVSVPAAATLVSAALVLGVGGGLVFTAWHDDGGGRPAAVQPVGPPSSARPAVGPPGAPGSAFPSATPAGCAAALASADAALAEADKVDAALATQTQVMNALMAHRITSSRAVKQVAPALTAGAQHSIALDVAIQRYRAVVTGCRP